MNSDNYKEMIAELRVEYLASFDSKFDMMRSFYEGTDWYSLELEFHKLKGTGTTYGVPEVTELCEHIERICRENKSLQEKTLNQAISVLTKIKTKYNDDTDFDMSQDPEYLELKKL